MFRCDFDVMESFEEFGKVNTTTQEKERYGKQYHENYINIFF